MNWINDLQKAINYLEDNLTEDISYADVAGQANYSPYHFQNLFVILCGCTLGEYIRCRRLTLAGKELASTKCRVIDVEANTGRLAAWISRCIRREICSRRSTGVSFGFR